MTLEGDLNILRAAMLSGHYESVMSQPPELTPKQKKKYKHLSAQLMFVWDVPPWLVDKEFDTPKWRFYWKFKKTSRWFMKMKAKVLGL